MRCFLAALVALATLALRCQCARHMRMVDSWHGVDFTFPSAAQRQAAIRDNSFIPANVVPIALEVDPVTERIFISMPRLKEGVAATLATVSSQKGHNGDHLLAPYPDWSWHKQGQCSGISSVFRVHVDECRRLWVVDTGLGGESQKCPPQLLVFDLDSDRLVGRHIFPRTSIKPDSVLTTIAVEVLDTSHKCRDTFAYVADVSGFGLLVFDNRHQESWRVTANEMYPYPPFGYFDIAGSQFDLMDGVLALALSPKGTDRTLYFHSLASDQESYVSTSVLRNKTNFAGGTNLVPRRFHTMDGRREAQAAAEAMDDAGVLFFSVLPKLSINCWNSAANQYGGDAIVQLDEDPKMFQFISGVTIKTNKRGEQELWTFSSRFQMHMNDGVDPNEVNYYVMKASIEALTRGTSCHVDRKSETGKNAKIKTHGGTGNHGHQGGSNTGNHGYQGSSNTGTYGYAGTGSLSGNGDVGQAGEGGDEIVFPQGQGGWPRMG